MLAATMVSMIRGVATFRVFTMSSYCEFDCNLTRARELNKGAQLQQLRPVCLQIPYEILSILRFTEVDSNYQSKFFPEYP